MSIRGRRSRYTLIRTSLIAALTAGIVFPTYLPTLPSAHVAHAEASRVQALPYDGDIAAQPTSNDEAVRASSADNATSPQGGATLTTQGGAGSLVVAEEGSDTAASTDKAPRTSVDAENSSAVSANVGDSAAPSTGSSTTPSAGEDAESNTAADADTQASTPAHDDAAHKDAAPRRREPRSLHSNFSPFRHNWWATNGRPSFQCNSSAVYTLDSNGTIRTLRATEDSNTVANGQPGMDEMDGLGISPDGSYAIAIQNSFPHSNYRHVRHYKLWRYTPDNGTWSPIRINNSEEPLARDFEPYYEAGAFNPVDRNYYFGYFTIREGASGRMRFQLHQLLPQGGNNYGIRRAELIIAEWPRSQNTGMNGDIAFDGRGNLYIMVGEHDGRRVHTYVVESHRLNQGGAVFPKLISSHTDMLRRANGIAFRAHEGTIISGGTDDPKNLGSFDMVDLSDVGQQPTYQHRLGQTRRDLASCEKPNTVVLKKNLPQRRNPSDQFILDIRRGTPPRGVTTPTMTTTDSMTGLQDKYVGPVPVLPGRAYELSEDINQGKLLRSYSPKWTCSVASGNQADQSQDNFTLNVPSNARNQEISCTVKNDVAGGTVTWEKVSNTRPVQTLSGSHWTITPDIPGAGPRPISDCTSNPCATLDKDSRPGHFRIELADSGTYTLREIIAPAGYELDATPRQIILTPTNFRINLGRIENRQVAPTTLRLAVRAVEGPQRQSSNIGLGGWTLGASLHNAPTGSTLRISGQNIPTQVTSTEGRTPEEWTLRLLNSGASATLRVTQQLRQRFTPDTLKCTYLTPQGRTESEFSLPIEKRHINRGRVTMDIPNVRPGKRLECVFENVRELATIVWSKVDAGSTSTHLAGSEWRLTSQGQNVRVIRDCVQAGQCNGSNDEDARPGHLSVSYLRPGDYTLTETLAPAGYQLNANPNTTFRIFEHDIRSNIGQITNRRRPPIVIPLTGGDAADTYTIIGFALMACAAALAVIMNRRRQTHAT